MNRQMIHMKYQALFSSVDKSKKEKKIEVLSAAIVMPRHEHHDKTMSHGLGQRSGQKSTLKLCA